MSDPRGYRPNVGIALFDARGRVFAGFGVGDGPEVKPPGFEWEMPQGGIDAGEEIVAAARRELREETGVTSVALLAVTREWWHYDWPPHAGPKNALDAFRGQRQRWVAFRFEGGEGEIDVARAPAHGPIEFTAWRWMRLADMPALVAPHKRATYDRVVAAFAEFAG